MGNGCFIFFFANRESRDDVWLGGSWHVAGYQLGLDQWTETFIPSKNPPMHVPTWIRIPGLPLHFWGEKNLRRIAAEIGEPLLIDTFTRERTRTIFARVCVRRNLSKPILGGIWLNSKANGKFFQKIVYEGMRSLCTSCGLAGHGDTPCKDPPAELGTNEATPTNPKAGLMVGPASTRGNRKSRNRGNLWTPPAMPINSQKFQPPEVQ